MHGSSMAQIKMIPMGGVWRSDEIVILCIQPRVNGSSMHSTDVCSFSTDKLRWLSLNIFITTRQKHYNWFNHVQSLMKM